MSENVTETAAENIVAAKKKSKTGLIIGIIVAAVLIAGAGLFVFFFFAGSSGRKVKKQIALGDKYLAELDYENAILSYKEAIKIDPKNEAPYFSLADAYRMEISYFEEAGDYEKALEYANNAVIDMSAGVDNTGSAKIQAALDELQVKMQDLLDKEKEIQISEETRIDFSNASVGDYVVFGKYEQDGDESNGAEPIEWEVLSVEGNRALLISKYVLDGFRIRQYGTWETSPFRKWLNDEFVNTAFTLEEQAQIPTVTLSNPGNIYWEGDVDENDTQDRVFLLGMEEIRKYYKFNSWHDADQYGFCQKLMTPATPYAINRGVTDGYFSDSDYKEYYEPEGYTSDFIGAHGAIWWLRTPGIYNPEYFICVVYGDGITGYSCGDFDVDFENLPGIRPALYVEW